MDPATRRHVVRGRLAGASLALALVASGGRAWGETPSQTAAALERAAALVETGAFEQAAPLLRRIVSADPANRRAGEMLAFALESLGDLEGERRVRSALAAEYPGDPRIQADYGRVLERSGEEDEALRAYRRGRELRGGGSSPELDAAIERMRGRTALELGTPLAVMSDPDATASSVRAGAAIPLGSGRHLSLLATRYAADRKNGPDATASDVLALSVVLRRGPGASWALGPSLHVVSPNGGGPRDVGLGGVVQGRETFGPSFEAEARAELEAPWDEAAVALACGGRVTGAEGYLYCHSFSRRLLLQSGARRRRLSILAAGSRSAGRPEAWQSLWTAGADVVVWRKPGDAVRGEMLDDALVAPATLSSAVTLAYRHYDVSTETTPEFASTIALVPRGSVNEASIAASVAPPRGRVGLEVHAGLARDDARGADVWRGGGALIWAPVLATRFALRYEGATEIATGLVGRRRAWELSFHVDL